MPSTKPFLIWPIDKTKSLDDNFNLAMIAWNKDILLKDEVPGTIYLHTVNRELLADFSNELDLEVKYNTRLKANQFKIESE